MAQIDNKDIKIAVGLSGGVDSAVSAFLLKEQGYDVTGVYIQCWEERADGCEAVIDRADSARVAGHLDIKFKSLNFVEQYKNRVITDFFNEYKKGRTPNPDVLCNKEIKFGLFLEWALKEGFDYIATGHYARVEKENSNTVLLKGLDETKDQSYFLYLLNQDQLARAMFPIGDLRKTEVREIARKVGFHNANKPDSVGICFIGEVNIKEFLNTQIEFKKGNVVNSAGEVIGEHDGVWFYTIGQRHGFKILKYQGLPMYVVSKNVDTNELVVGPAKEGKRNSFKIADVHWIGEEFENIQCDVRIRHLGELYPATYKKGEITLEYPVFGIAVGQSAVLYLGEKVIGGGIIQL